MQTVKLEKKKSHQVYKLKDGTRVPGASTVAKMGDDPGALIHWAWNCGMEGQDYKKVASTAADIGTLCHKMIEAHLNGQKLDTSECSPEDIDKAENAFIKFLEFWEREEMTIIGTEVQLVSERHGFGGTLDAPCLDREGNRTLFDWKTSKALYLSHFSQLAGYEHLWNENNPATPIQRRAIIRIGKEEKGDFEVRWLSDMDRYWELFQAQLALYKAKQKVGRDSP